MENTNKTTNLNEDYKFIRKALGFTQSNFAKLIGISVQTVSSIEKGSPISKDILSRTYVTFLGILSLAERKEVDLREEEIFFINKFLDKLVSELNKLAIDARQILKR